MRSEGMRTSKLALVGASASVALFLLITLRVSCEPSQQQQTQPNELTSQNYGFASGGDALAGFGGLALGSSARGPYTNAKRARKMSAFMPMRGRKDGRDLLGPDSLRDLDSLDQLRGRSFGGGAPASNQDNDFARWPVRESDPNDEGLLRLASASGGGLGMVPRQFLSQFGQRLGGNNNNNNNPNRQAQPQQQHAMMTRGGLPGPVALSSSGNLMEAKLRRAFHPMRGKKWTPFGEQLAELEGQADSES